MDKPTSVLGLDIGGVRIGVARALWPDGIAERLGVLSNDNLLVDNLTKLVSEHNVALIVAGIPRSMDGNETVQTRETLRLVDTLKLALKLPIYLQDEAATSLKAEAELKAAQKPYSKGDIDALSAVYILQDFIAEHPGGGLKS